MKYLIRFLFLLMPVFAIGQTGFDSNTIQLANRYFHDKEFEKAADLYKEIYSKTFAKGYFDQFLNCLIQLKEYNLAEKEIRKELRKRGNKVYFNIQMGSLLKAQNRYSEADLAYQKVLDELSDNKAAYKDAARAFMSKGEYDFAGKVYRQGREQISGVDFYYDLARIYLIQRNYDSMMLEYLDWLKESEANLPSVKMGLNSIYRADVGEEVSQQIKSILLKRMQQDAGINVFSRLLIWLFVQDKNFPAAIRQSIALDKRTSDEASNILQLADVATNNYYYQDAEAAYNYLIDKGDQSSLYFQAYKQRMQMYYERYLNSNIQSVEETHKLKEQFDETFRIIGNTGENTELMVEYAHFMAFHLTQAEDAVVYLEKALTMPRLSTNQISMIKAEQGDVSAYLGDYWGAILTYSQVIEANKSNPLGDEMKFKKARLGYFMGNFEWAKALLEALRASTSKLIANDAMELSLFIGDNLNLDTTALPLQMFTRADLQQFRDNDSLALLVLDSLTSLYPHHFLGDDIYYRKAQIFWKRGDATKASEFLTKIITEYRFDMLCDDAIMMLANMYENELSKKEEALELYKKVLTDFQGSIHAVTAREKYRRLEDELKVKE